MLRALCAAYAKRANSTCSCDALAADCFADERTDSDKGKESYAFRVATLHTITTLQRKWCGFLTTVKSSLTMTLAFGGQARCDPNNQKDRTPSQCALQDVVTLDTRVTSVVPSVFAMLLIPHRRRPLRGHNPTVPPRNRGARQQPAAVGPSTGTSRR